MASKSPLQKLQDAVVETVKGAITHPRDTAAKAGEQAKGTISLGRAVAGQVTKTAAGVVASRLPGHRAPAGGSTRTPAVEVPRSRAEATPEATTEATAGAEQPIPTKPPVTDVATALVKQQAAKRPAPTPTPAPVSPIDAAADSAHVEATPADLAKRATTARKAAKKAPAKTAATKRAPAKKVTAKKPAAKKAAAKKAASTPSDRLPPRKQAVTPDADRD